MNKPPLAAEHKGMRVNGGRVLRENRQGFSFFRKEMARHLEMVAERFYSGDVTVVDEFLQLYCFGEDQRKEVCSVSLK